MTLVKSFNTFIFVPIHFFQFFIIKILELELDPNYYKKPDTPESASLLKSLST
jgi:hypothetical protein